jgi:hypothetical protein
LNEQLKGVTATVDRRAPDNDVLRIDSEKGEFHLAALKRKEKPDAVKKTKAAEENRPCGLADRRR